MSKQIIPKWIEEGPMDLEYKNLKMLACIKKLKRKLLTGELLDVLYEVDDTLDYLYRYDAQQITRNEPTEYEVMGLQWEDLEMVFTTEEELITNDILDVLVESAIDKFEELHATCRETWRDIEDNIMYSYIGDRKYFLSDGFVFIKTADNKLHLYYFTKPTKAFNMHWKDFKMQHIKSEEWNDDTYFARLEEISGKKSSKILIKVNLNNQTKVENHAMAVINYCIFSLLRKDYTF
jgi:hypothetical protein|tara:strand:+ start:2973 stop:3677 length:705 start_codon:yes stop_codon:yes gene_type:complete